MVCYRKLTFLVVLLALASCAGSGAGSNIAVDLVILPLRIITVAVAALIGAAAGMGT